MTRKILFVASIVWLPFTGLPQGLFIFSNIGLLPTHIGSIDGPLAGTGFWAQMLAGPGPLILAPVGVPREYLDSGGLPTGLVAGGSVAVPGIPAFQTAYVEMLSWNGTRW